MSPYIIKSYFLKGENNMKKFIPNFKIPTQEELEKIHREFYEDARANPENMSYWFPKIATSKTRDKTILKIPETRFFTLDQETVNWLRSDHYTEEAKQSFNRELNSFVGNFQKDKPLFIKTGIFSDKFVFKFCYCKDRSQLGAQMLDIYYESMILGADCTAEVVFREFIEDKDHWPKIYEGMPLHTEFRYFYDFDKKKLLGVANYWHPDLMLNHLRDKDKFMYKQALPNLLENYESYKKMIAHEISSYLEGVTGLMGKWSIDVMKNGDDFWLIDMARMEKSALTELIEPV